MKDFGRLFFITASLALVAAACTKDNSSPQLQSGNWVARAQFSSFARYGVSSFVIEDTAYAVCGYDGKTFRYNDCWAYNPNTNSWTQKASIPVPAGAPGANGRSRAVGFTVNNKGYISTGEEAPVANSGRLKDTWEYDASGNNWLQKDDFPEPTDVSTGLSNGRVDAMGFAIDNYGYLTCGFNGTNQNDVWQFNPVAVSGAQWQQIVAPAVSPIGKRRGGAVFVYNKEVYIVTGENNLAAVYDFYKFNPATLVWTQLRAINNKSPDTYDNDYTDIGRSYGVGFVMNNGNVPKGYITVGQINGANTMKTWEYDFATDLWARKTSYEISRPSRTFAVSFVVKGRAFVGLGLSINLALDNLDEWIPDEAYNSND